MTVQDLRAERIKIVSARGTWLGLVLAAGLSLLYGIGMAFAVNARFETTNYTLSNAGATEGIRTFGVMVLMAIAALAVTSEYRYRTIALTYAASPGRVPSLVSKAVVMGALGFATALAVGVVAAVASEMLVRDDAKNGVGLATGEGWRILLGVAVLVTFACVMAVGVGALTRATAPAVALVILMPAVIEGIIGRIPGLGDAVAPFLPFGNAGYGAIGKDSSGVEYVWGPGGALLYFAALCTAVLMVAVVVTRRRDV